MTWIYLFNYKKLNYISESNYEQALLKKNQFCLSFYRILNLKKINYFIINQYIYLLIWMAYTRNLDNFINKNTWVAILNDGIIF